jgi:hypothetical protein
MSRAHVEIAHTIRRLGRLLDDFDCETVDDTDLAEFRLLLYGLYALLRLHCTQEEEGYFRSSKKSDKALTPSWRNGDGAGLPVCGTAPDSVRSIN